MIIGNSALVLALASGAVVLVPACGSSSDSGSGGAGGSATGGSGGSATGGSGGSATGGSGGSATGGSGGSATGGSGGSATGGAAGSGGGVTGGAGGADAGSFACGSAQTCAADQLCVKKAGGAGFAYACEANPCSSATIDCSCAGSLCGGAPYTCTGVQDRTVSCDCPTCA